MTVSYKLVLMEMEIIIINKFIKAIIF